MHNRRNTRYGNRPAGSNRIQPGFKRNGRRVNFSKSKGPRKAYINPDRFIKKAKPLKLTTYTTSNTFTDFDLHKSVHGQLHKLDINEPTQIQDQSIPHSLAGRDVLGLANTGTGKTIAFLAPVLSRIKTHGVKQVLVVAPTRELAEQIQTELRRLSRNMHVYDALVIGGVSIGRQIKALSRNPHVIIGTPGRLKDHLERGTLDLSSLDVVVLDEVDRMLDMGFVNDIRTILGSAPRERQSLFFSATMDSRVESLVYKFGNDPIKITATTSDTSDNVEQSVTYYRDNSDKIELLHEILITDEIGKVLIFCDTKRFSDSLARELESRGFKSGAIHGNKSQSQRKRALDKLKQGHLSVLVATDVAARGIDVDGITHVINYDTPGSYEDYTHRIGRTGRGNTQGYSVTFVQKNR